MSAEFETIYHVLPVTAANGQNSRRQRLAERLKENLRKRKAQKRARDQQNELQESPTDDDSLNCAAGEPHQLDIKA